MGAPESLCWHCTLHGFDGEVAAHERRNVVGWESWREGRLLWKKKTEWVSLYSKSLEHIPPSEAYIYYRNLQNSPFFINPCVYSHVRDSPQLSSDRTTQPTHLISFFKTHFNIILLFTPMYPNKFRAFSCQIFYSFKSGDTVLPITAANCIVVGSNNT